jgi:hypothetical protein
MSISMAIYDQTQRPLLTGSLPMETRTKRDHSSLEMTLRFVAAHGASGHDSCPGSPLRVLAPCRC